MKQNQTGDFIFYMCVSESAKRNKCVSAGQALQDSVKQALRKDIYPTCAWLIYDASLWRQQVAHAHESGVTRKQYG